MKVNYQGVISMCGRVVTAKILIHEYIFWTLSLFDVVRIILLVKIMGNNLSEEEKYEKKYREVKKEIHPVLGEICQV